MPYESHPYVSEPNGDAAIWRFMDMGKFRDLMANQELYFRRADRFAKDPNEGVPPEEWLRATLKLRQFVLEDEVRLNHEKGTLAQFREASYVTCWYLYTHEDPEMWREFAPYGVAVCSRYDFLKEALNSVVDPAHMGLTRYGYQPTDPYNLTQFIYTKGTEFSREQEVRVVITCNDPVAGNNRHIGPTNFPHERPLKANRLHKWVHDGKRRRINLKPVVNGVVVSPWASDKVCREVEDWVRFTNMTCGATRSGLRSKCFPSPKQRANVLSNSPPRG